jgi:hypothetical protein
VRNVGSAWLGVTLGCCQCHDHKYDPFTTRDFYAMAAFFSDIQEPAVGSRGAGTLLANVEQSAQLAELDAALDDARSRLMELESATLAEPEKWEAELLSGNPDQLPESVRTALATASDSRSVEQSELIRTHRLESACAWTAARDHVKMCEQRRAEFVQRIPRSLTVTAGPRRTVRVLPRGNWLDESGEEVQPATPEVLVRLSAGGALATRLDLANWIVAPDNPLTSRVFVNRIWRLLFGAGLSRTLDDIGMQGELPSHPELLDWLAVDFVEHGWDVKRLVKLIVMSNVYQQSSLPRLDLSERDPNNRLLARQNRFRYDAETVRDTALAVSGLLSRRIGGASVKPYQPSGYWAALNFPTREWQNDTGEGLYRRGLYTHWQRSFLHPSLLAFDAPSREECVVDRARSNLPQQALILLNDPTYVEAARSLAQRALEQTDADPAQGIQWAWQEVLQRSTTPEEQRLLVEFYQRQRARFESNPTAASQMIEVGEWPLPSDASPLDLAAWTATMRVILNLHETITRQ